MATHNSGEYDKVFIKDLCVDMYAGIYDFEKSASQRVIINIEIDVITNKNRGIDSIHDVLSYEDICNEVTEICNKQHYELIETLAEVICASCLNHKQANSIILSIDKPDIIENTKTVGIQIKRIKA